MDKDHKQKLILIQTLKPHLLKVDVIAGHNIIGLCLDRLSDDTIVTVRSLSSHILTIMFQVMKYLLSNILPPILAVSDRGKFLSIILKFLAVCRAKIVIKPPNIDPLYLSKRIFFTLTCLLISSSWSPYLEQKLQVYPDRIITGLAKEEHNNREYCILSSKLIIKALNRTELSFQEVNKFSLHFEEGRII